MCALNPLEQRVIKDVVIFFCFGGGRRGRPALVVLPRRQGKKLLLFQRIGRFVSSRSLQEENDQLTSS